MVIVGKSKMNCFFPPLSFWNCWSCDLPFLFSTIVELYIHKTKQKINASYITGELIKDFQNSFWQIMQKHSK